MFCRLEKDLNNNFNFFWGGGGGGTEIKVVKSAILTDVFTPKTLVKVLWYRVTGFFLMLSVVKCRQITSTVINYHVGWTISRYVT